MTTIRSGAVQVHGLAELSRDLRALDRNLQRELRKANKDAASTVADAARSRAYSIGGVAAHVAPSIKASAGATSAGVAFGSNTYAMAGGAEFGSVQYSQFKAWTGSGPGAGYFVYPTIRDDEREWLEPYEDAVDRLTKMTGPTT